MGNIENEQQDTGEQLLAACWKGSGNSEKIFAHSILASPGLTVHDFFASP